MLIWMSMLLICSLNAAQILPPLACLHKHADTAMTDYDIVTKAQADGVQIPDTVFPTLYSYNADNWPSFDAAYCGPSQYLAKDPSYFKWLALVAANNMKKQGVIYGELAVSPDVMTYNCAQPIDWKDGLLAYQQGLTEAQQDGTITLTAQLTFRRGAPNGAQAALDYVKYVSDNRATLPDFRGFNLSGDEHADNLETFLPAYQLAKANGFGCTVHAGEFGSADTDVDQTLGINNMRQALAYKTPDGKSLFDRIGHGIATSLPGAADVRQTLLAQGAPLEVSVSSNHCLGHMKTLKDHPLPDLIAQGIVCCYGNDDDGRIFNTNNQQEILKMQNTFGFTTQDIYNNTVTTINHAFLSQAKKDLLLAKLAAWKIQYDNPGKSCVIS